MEKRFKKVIIEIQNNDMEYITDVFRDYKEMAMNLRVSLDHARQIVRKHSLWRDRNAFYEWLEIDKEDEEWQILLQTASMARTLPTKVSELLEGN